MEYINLKISSEIMRIPIERKQMKRVRLRVYPNGEIKISAPIGVSYEWINEYIGNKKEWINKKLSEFKTTNGIEAVNIISNGTTIKLFGRDYYTVIKESIEKKVNIDENSLIIHTTNTNNQRVLSNQLELWLKKELMLKVDSYIDKLYPIVKKYGIKKPDYNIRKMRDAVSKIV